MAICALIQCAVIYFFADWAMILRLGRSLVRAFLIVCRVLLSCPYFCFRSRFCRLQGLFQLFGADVTTSLIPGNINWGAIWGAVDGFVSSLLLPSFHPFLLQVYRHSVVSIRAAWFARDSIFF